MSKTKSKIFKYIKGFGVNVLGSGFNLTFEDSKKIGIDSQTFLLDSLLNIWSDISKHSKLLVILIDDVQNISMVKSFFTDLRNVLSEDEMIKGTKILFVLSSTIEGWMPFLQVNHPIGRFFIPRLNLNDFNKDDAYELVGTILDDSGVKFSNSIKEKLYKYTNGHLFQIHVLSSCLYNNNRDGKVTDAEWDESFEDALAYLGNAVYDGIVKGLSNNDIKVFRSLDPFNLNRASTIERKSKLKNAREYNQPLRAYARSMKPDCRLKACPPSAEPDTPPCSRTGNFQGLIRNFLIVELKLNQSLKSLEV